MFAGLEQPTHLLFILLIVLLLFGAKRLPELGRSMGRSLQEFRSGMNPKDEPQEEKKHPEAVEERHSATAKEQEAQREREATTYARRGPAPSDRDL